MSLLTNLVAYYKFDDNALTTDSAGSNTTTNNNTVADTSSGKIGYGAEFGSPNSSKYFSLASSLVTTDKTTAAYTVTAWVNASSFVTADSSTVVGLCTNGKLRCKLGIRDSSGLKLDWNTYNGSTGQALSSSAQTFNLDTWYFVGWTMNGTTLTFYRNGTNLGTATVTINNGVGESDAFAIGRGTADNGNFWSKWLDEIGVWSRVLTDDEMTELYNSGNGLQYPFGISDSNSGFFSLM